MQRRKAPQALYQRPRLGMPLPEAHRGNLDRLLQAVPRRPHHLIPSAIAPLHPSVRRPPQRLPMHREAQIRRVPVVQAHSHQPLGQLLRGAEAQGAVHAAADGYLVDTHRQLQLQSGRNVRTGKKNLKSLLEVAPQASLRFSHANLHRELAIRERKGGGEAGGGGIHDFPRC